MQSDKSLWLGPMRRPVWLAMVICIATTLALAAWFILARILNPQTAYDMQEMIRPAGKPLVQVTLLALTGALVFGSAYLSDTKGAIESEPHGFFDILSLVLARLAMIGVVFIVLVMFYEVVARYVFGAPTLWANEMSLWIASLVFLLSGQYAMQQRSHIRIYIIYDGMPRWMQKGADVISVALIVGFTFVLVWGSFDDASARLARMEGLGTAWNPPIPGTVKPAILFIIVLVALQAVSNLIADWNKAPGKHSEEPDAHEIESIRRTLEEPK
ncbi:MAG: TRAP transporter small permease subunit [Tropicimonas sp.]|uniref:TRAP transporter small permease subunit n=1 Tax=Tropicimonas sp. TaxID=2067044 RepID=UPI003A8B9F74